MRVAWRSYAADQVATRVATVYEVPMPNAVAQLLSVFELININIASIRLPLQCFVLGNYISQLAFTINHIHQHTKAC